MKDKIPNKLLIPSILIVVIFAVAPLMSPSYVQSVLFSVIFFSFVGQAWNLMMGFAGQLSLGHTLYVGLGGYISAALFLQWAVNPWLGMLCAASVAGAVGALIAFLGFRFSIKDVHFALLTIAFAECARILFDHMDFFGGSAGLFLPLSQEGVNNILTLRGSHEMYYYLLLSFTIALFFFCRWLLSRPVGYFWLAIREDSDAAESLGINLLRTKVTAVALSGSITAIGGVIYAFYQSSLFPDQTFAMHRSIEILMGPIVGGVGTLFGPIFGAIILTPLGELISYIIEESGVQLPGIKHLFYGLSMLIIMIKLPKGLWPQVKIHVFKKKSGDVF